MLKTELRPHQSEAVAAALQHDGFAFFPEQRTGKLLCSLAVIDARKPDIVFVICPKAAFQEWEEQPKEHLHLDWECQFEVINFEATTRNKQKRRWYRAWVRRELKKGKTIMCVCDEAHRIKKRGSAQSMFVRSIGKKATWRLALTGTPIGQGYENAWAIFDFCNHLGIFGTYEEFEKRYLIYGGYERREIVGYRHEDELKALIHKYSYRITFNEARRAMGKKPVRIRKRKVYFNLTKSSREIYDELEKEMEVVIDGLRINSPLPVTLPLKLQQLCGGSLIQDFRVPGQRKKRRVIAPVGVEKLAKMVHLLTSIKGPVVICARYTHEIAEIRGALSANDYTHKEVSGKSPYDGRFDTDVVVLQGRSGIAFDLSLANNYILYSWDESFIAFEQARFRVMNLELTEQVNYFFLIARNTIEEIFYQAVARKKAFATLVLDTYRKTGPRKVHRFAARRVRKAGNQT